MMWMERDAIRTEQQKDEKKVCALEMNVYAMCRLRMPREQIRIDE